MNVNTARIWRRGSRSHRTTTPGGEVGPWATTHAQSQVPAANGLRVEAVRVRAHSLLLLLLLLLLPLPLLLLWRRLCRVLRRLRRLVLHLRLLLLEKVRMQLLRWRHGMLLHGMLLHGMLLHGMLLHAMLQHALVVLVLVQVLVQVLVVLALVMLVVVLDGRLHHAMASQATRTVHEHLWVGLIEAGMHSW